MGAGFDRDPGGLERTLTAGARAALADANARTLTAGARSPQSVASRGARQTAGSRSVVSFERGDRTLTAGSRVGSAFDHGERTLGAGPGLGRVAAPRASTEGLLDLRAKSSP